MTRRLGAALAYLIAVAGFSVGVWWFALTADLDDLAKNGEADLLVASDRLVGQLQRYRELAVLMSDHPQLTGLMSGKGNAASASALLQEIADKTGSLEILAVSTGGHVLAASDGNTRPLTGEPYLDRAVRDGALGAYHEVYQTKGRGGRRVFTFAAPIFGEEGPVIGAIVVRIDGESIEAAWRGAALGVFFSDNLGVIFASNRSELLFMVRDKTAPGTTSGEARYDAGSLTAFPSYRPFQVAGLEIWRLDAGRYLPRTAIHLTRPLPVIGMTGEALVDIAPAMWLALWQALVAAALGLTSGAFILILSDRRRALAERLSLEAAANVELEARVNERTSALSAANLALRREVDERIAAEAALKKAQDDLVQAGKLSALGQMSAGISHELNQPLMAISSFAENGEAFLERKQPGKAAENLGRISDMARRMGRIIRNLRAFARQEIEPVRPVDMVSVVDVVLELSAGRLKREGVKLIWDRPQTPVFVRGGDVRLQQVVMNLVSNALDAMEDVANRALTLSLQGGHPVALSVSDTGHGILAPDKMFDPFYSTKEVGQSEGMGLGLSISYRIVQSFDGTIRGWNNPDGGAVFVVELDPVRLEEAA